MKRSKTTVIVAISLILVVLLAIYLNYSGSRGNVTVELEFFLDNVRLVAAHERIADIYMEENPHIGINFVAPPDAEAALLARIATGDPPDIMNIYPAEVLYRSYMADGMFVDITDHPMLDRIPADILAISELNGRQYAIPIALSGYGVFYNKDIFAAHGFMPPTTYAEFIQLCRALQEAGELPLVFFDRSAGGVGQMTERFSGILDNDIHDTFGRIAAGDLSIWDVPEVRVLAETLLEIRQYGQMDQLGTDADQALSEFMSGNAAMMIGGTWYGATILETNPDMNFSMFPFPNPMGTVSKIPINIDTSWAISVEASSVDTALDFLNFMVRPDIIQMFANASASPIVVEGVDFPHKQLEVINNEINSGNIFRTPVIFWPPGMRANWQEIAQQLFIDHDIDKFITNTEIMIKQFYNK